jgi:cell division protein FtsQ
MKANKLTVKIAMGGIGVAAFIISVGFASHKQATMPCSGVIVNVLDSVGSGFVDKNDIIQSIQNKFGTLEGKSLSSINISLLEKIINTNPFISDAEVFSTVDGKIEIEVKQRIPVLRVINYKNESFYVDKDGVFMPVSDKFTSRVPVANGFIFDSEAGHHIITYTEDSAHAETKLAQLFNIIGYTEKNNFWNAEVQQLYVNEDGEIEMIPRVGNHSVILGDDKDLDEKFSKLLVFYKEGISKKGWDKYKSINLKFKNQVVCTKK